ncbi:MAG: hypothetical protein IPJ78_06100 [Gemmatimonadetes bacterium]|nr:hypothetical protein [Gemmatimonadota bacterium]
MASRPPVQFRAQPIDGIDLDFRPASYWDAADPAAAITQNIKGQLRREMVRDFISGDAPAILGEIDDALVADEVSDETRRFLGRMHPSWMGGEYLPGYPRGEVEIARIVLKSTMGDVMSIRARRTRAGTVLLRLVDEYESEFRSVHSRVKRPLTLGQLVEFIDNVRMVGEQPPTLPFVEACIVYGAEGDIGFASLESDVYTELGVYYALRLEAWDASKRGDDYEEVEDDA